jgi:hypothetical protein
VRFRWNFKAEVGAGVFHPLQQVLRCGCEKLEIIWFFTMSRFFFFVNLFCSFRKHDWYVLLLLPHKFLLFLLIQEHVFGLRHMPQCSLDYVKIADAENHAL